MIEPTWIDLAMKYRKGAPWPEKVILPQWKIDHYVGLGYPRDMFEVSPELPEELK